MLRRHVQEQGPFQLPAAGAAPVPDALTGALMGALRAPLKRLLRLSTLNTMYARANAAPRDPDDAADFIRRALCELNLESRLARGQRKDIPATGPLVVVCNHPFGVVEGLVLAQLLLSVRPDVKILANHLLSAIPEMRPMLIELDPFGGEGAKTRNMAGLRAALAWLKEGGALLAFPAGEVSSLAVKKRMVADPPWQRGVAGIVRRTKAPVLPVFIHGRNSALFQAAGLVHPRLRTLLLPRENLGRCGTELSLSIGAPIAPEKLAALPTDDDLSAYLRFRCHLLRATPQDAGASRPRRFLSRAPRQKALAAPRPQALCQHEIAALPPERVLAAGAPFVVVEARAHEIPALMHEVARLRESTFRGVGEGTGQPLDTDRFDAHYRHLILWHEADREVAGAYRFAGTDEVLPHLGPAGLYTASQFRLARGFWDRLDPALELGRSFIRTRYQKSYQPLLLLWKGLAEYVVRNPRYRTLFGCVSISGDYSALARELMMAFLRRHSFDAELARLVKPTRAPKARSLHKIDLCVPEAAFRDPSDLNELVAEVEGGRGIPVLLRQYLKLGGRIAAFNLDPGFGDCLDGLISVDLARTDARTLARFMGSGGARRFLDHHGAHGAQGAQGEDRRPPRAA